MFSLILEGVTANWLSPMHFASIKPTLVQCLSTKIQHTIKVFWIIQMKSKFKP